MNTRYENYLMSLTPAKRLVAKEAVAEFLKSEAEPMKKLTSATSVYNLCKDLAAEEEEHAVIVLAKQNLRMIKRIEVGHGGLTDTLFDVRVIIREAITNNATIVFMVHNHPSGDIKPSRQDDGITKSFNDALSTVKLHLADHIIIGKSTYYSYHENGRL